jgi:hypothetical protein
MVDLRHVERITGGQRPPGHPEVVPGRLLAMAGGHHLVLRPGGDAGQEGALGRRLEGPQALRCPRLVGDFQIPQVVAVDTDRRGPGRDRVMIVDVVL